MDKPMLVFVKLLLLLVLAITNSLAEAGTVTNDNRENSGDSNDLLSAAAVGSSFPFYAKMDDYYELRWKFNSTHIVFQMKVKAKGYIGFGISQSGGMFPADVIIGWVKDGEVHFKDRHTIAYFTPVVDGKQDWKVLSGTEDGEYTTLVVIRQLDTCDKADDIPIGNGMVQLIYSYSDEDPASDDNIPYHLYSRGAKSVNLLRPPVANVVKTPLPADVTTVDILNKPDYVISDSTRVSCHVIEAPSLNGNKHHMIRYEPLIPEDQKEMIRHMVLHSCKKGVVSESVAKIGKYNCVYNPPEELVEGCQAMIISWAVGGHAFDFPPHVGFSLGGQGDPDYFVLETHFHHNLKSPDVSFLNVSGAGFRLFLTQQLRQHDAGLLKTGVRQDGLEIIPPYSKNFRSRGACYEDCLGEALGDDAIHVFAEMFYSNLIGKRLVTRHVRNGTELVPIYESRDYDSNYHETLLFGEERTVEKGDSLITDCYYNTLDRDFVTYGGYNKKDESCLSYLFYYPKKPIAYCLSRVAYNKDRLGDDEGSIFDIVNKMDFTKQSVRDRFESLIDRSKMMSACNVKGKFEFKLKPQPVISKPFVEKAQCGKK